MAPQSSVNFTLGALRRLGRREKLNARNSPAFAGAAAALVLLRDEVSLGLKAPLDDVDYVHRVSALEQSVRLQRHLEIDHGLPHARSLRVGVQVADVSGKFSPTGIECMSSICARGNSARHRKWGGRCLFRRRFRFRHDADEFFPTESTGDPRDVCFAEAARSCPHQDPVGLLLQQIGAPSGPSPTPSEIADHEIYMASAFDCEPRDSDDDAVDEEHYMEDLNDTEEYEAMGRGFGDEEMDAHDMDTHDMETQNMIAHDIDAHALDSHDMATHEMDTHDMDTHDMDTIDMAVLDMDSHDAPERREDDAHAGGVLETDPLDGIWSREPITLPDGSSWHVCAACDDGDRFNALSDCPYCQAPPAFRAAVATDPEWRTTSFTIEAIVQRYTMQYDSDYFRDQVFV